MFGGMLLFLFKHYSKCFLLIPQSMAVLWCEASKHSVQQKVLPLLGWTDERLLCHGGGGETREATCSKRQPAANLTPLRFIVFGWENVATADNKMLPSWIRHARIRVWNKHSKTSIKGRKCSRPTGRYRSKWRKTRCLTVLMWGREGGTAADTV